MSKCNIKMFILKANVCLALCSASHTSRVLGLSLLAHLQLQTSQHWPQQECKRVHQVVNTGTEPKLKIISYTEEGKSNKARNTLKQTYCLLIILATI